MSESEREFGERLAGSRVRYGPTGRVQRVKTGGWQWSDEAEELFFDELAASCNVRAAAAAVGFATPTVYRLRRMRPDFAARWKAALEHGYARLEMELLKTALASIEGKAFDDSRPIPNMTVEQAMNVLRAHRNAVEGDGRGGPGRRARRRSLDEVRESIRKKVAAIRGMEAPGDAGADAGGGPAAPAGAESGDRGAGAGD